MMLLPVNNIDIPAKRIRSPITDESIEELMKSIEKYGVLSAITVKPLEYEEYEVIAGTRRLKAAKKLNLERIPCIVRKDITNQNALLMELEENIQRKDLTALECANTLKRFLDENPDFDQSKLATKMSKSKGWVSQRLKLLTLPESTHPYFNGTYALSQAHAEALYPLLTSTIADKEARICELTERAYSEQISSRKLEELVEKVIKEQPKAPKQSLTPELQSALTNLQKIYSHKVKIKATDEGGFVISTEAQHSSVASVMAYIKGLAEMDDFMCGRVVEAPNVSNEIKELAAKNPRKATDIFIAECSNSIAEMAADTISNNEDGVRRFDTDSTKFDLNDFFDKNEEGTNVSATGDEG